MANNRLYIGNKKTKQYMMFCKSNDAMWYNWYNMDQLMWHIEDDDGSWIGNKTNLVFFTEYDELYDWFMDNGENIREY